MFRFEKFDVWQQSVEFADNVYGCTRGFPREEQFGLTSQMRRASVSISSNIAEGSSRSSDKDFARFVELAYGSLMELVSQSSIAKRQALLTEPQLLTIYHMAEHCTSAKRPANHIMRHARIMMRSDLALSTQPSALRHA